MATLRTLCKLQKERIEEILTEAAPETVMKKRGVWNEYEKTKTQDAIAEVKRSDYGADLRIDDDSGAYYVSIPVDSDMW